MKPVKLNCMTTNPPKEGKFVALYNDGSGASLFVCVYDDRNELSYFDCEGEKYYEECMGNYSSWIPLPDTYNFWKEEQK